MSIAEFSWVPAIIGGVLIGIAVVVMMAMLGKVAGVSGIASSLLRPFSAQSWQWAFVLGLLFSGFIVDTLFSPLQIEIEASTTFLLVAGLLVGFGSRLANGCTSGHGVCGLARLSARSIVATLVFMSTAALTVFIFH